MAPKEPDDTPERPWKGPGLAGTPPSATEGPALPDSGDQDPWDSRFDVTAKVPREAWPQRGERSHPVLRVAAGPDLLAFLRLEPGVPAVVGRDEQADLQLRDTGISRAHARLVLTGEREVIVTDLDSTNGVRLDDRPVKRGIMVPGSHLELGTVSLRLDLMTDLEIRHLAKVRARLLMADNRDPLTGLLTRAFLEDALPRMAAVCAQSDLPLCCLFFDLDHFKRVNDNFGHAAGDSVLEVVAQLALLGCRDTDNCLRYGGEEFVVILQGSDISDAVRAGRRLCRSVQGYDWSRATPGHGVTVSVGVAQRRVNEDLGAWIGRADRAMYVAKRQGRNRVVPAVGD